MQGWAGRHRRHRRTHRFRQDQVRRRHHPVPSISGANFCGELVTCWWFCAAQFGGEGGVGPWVRRECLHGGLPHGSWWRRRQQRHRRHRFRRTRAQPSGVGLGFSPLVPLVFGSDWLDAHQLLALMMGQGVVRNGGLQCARRLYCLVGLH